MKRWIPAALIALLPAWALAQPVRVQSGDHPGYTRLALLFGEVPEWAFGRVPGGFELRPEAPDITYNTAGVYRRIGRTRIAEISQRDDGRLFLEVSCDCHADVFRVPGALVIDIRSGPAPESARFEAPLDPVALPEPPREAVEVPPPAKPERPKAILTNLGPLESDAFRTPHAWSGELALDLAPPPTDPGIVVAEPEPDVLDDETLDRLARMQADLIAQLSRAASQGMIETDERQIETALANANARVEETPAEPEPEPEPEPAPEPEPSEEPETGLDALEELENVRIETALDRGQSGPPPVVPMTFDGDRCISDEQLDIAGWGETPDDGAELGLYRGRIVGEFDAADPVSIAALVRHYLYLTFGLEARAQIQAFDPDLPDAAIYLAMSEIMDDGHTHGSSPFDDQYGCRNRAAMWAVLSRETLRPTDPVATKSVIAAFSELPLHLRRHLGPWLVERFIGIGDSRTASALRNAVARAPGDHGDGLRLMDADIALEAGDEAAGTAHLESIVVRNSELAPEALIRLIDTRLDSGQTVAAKDRDNAAALAFANRKTALGADLKRVQIRALAHGGNVEGAVAELAAYRDDLGPDVSEALTIEIFGLAAADAPPDAFLKLVLPGPVKLGPSTQADEVRRAIAARLIDMGLAEPARLQLSDDPSLATDADRLLYAKVYLQERRPDLMIGYLAGLETPEARMLLAQAQELAMEYSRAAETYAGLGEDGARADAEWRARNWPETAASGTGIERDAAALVTGLEIAGPDPDLPEDTPEPPAPGSLAESRALLEQSRESRRILEELLAASELPEN